LGLASKAFFRVEKTLVTFFLAFPCVAFSTALAPFKTFDVPAGTNGIAAANKSKPASSQFSLASS